MNKQLNFPKPVCTRFFKKLKLVIFGFAVEVIDFDVACHQFCVNCVQFVLGRPFLLGV